jgi:hypothetical protein
VPDFTADPGRVSLLVGKLGAPGLLCYLAFCKQGIQDKDYRQHEQQVKPPASRLKGKQQYQPNYEQHDCNDPQQPHLAFSS